MKLAWLLAERLSRDLVAIGTFLHIPLFLPWVPFLQKNNKLPYYKKSAIEG